MRRAGGARVGPAAALVLCAFVVLAAPTAGAATRDPIALATLVVGDVGPNFTVTAQGPLDAAAFAADTPNPEATESALATRPPSAGTYQRAWTDEGGHNEVRDLLVQFTSAPAAEAFLQRVQHSLASGNTVSSTAVSSIPGARQTTYLVSSASAGIGQVVSMRAGVFVDVWSFFTAAIVHARSMPPDARVQVAQAQYAALVAAPGGAPGGGEAGLTLGALAWAVLAVAVLAAAVATPAFLRRRRRADQVP